MVAPLIWAAGIYVASKLLAPAKAKAAPPPSSTPPSTNTTDAGMEGPVESASEAIWAVQDFVWGNAPTPEQVRDQVQEDYTQTRDRARAVAQGAADTTVRAVQEIRARSKAADAAARVVEGSAQVTAQVLQDAQEAGNQAVQFVEDTGTQAATDADAQAGEWISSLDPRTWGGGA